VTLPRLALLLSAALLASMIVATTSAHAQGYPNRPIKLLVGFSAGGSTDLVARLLAKHSEKYLGQSLVVENKPGAAGMLALNDLVTAKPDGYTLGVTNSGMVTQPIYGTARFDYPVELQAIAEVGEIPFVLVAKCDAEWKTLDDLMKFARTHPDQVKYGITGVGNTAHLGPAQLQLEAKFPMDAVNFDGGARLIAALLGGHIQAGGINPVDVKEHVKAGRICALVVFGEKRLEDPLYKDVPTAKEKGYDIQVTLWQGVGAPKGLPSDLKQKLAEGFSKMLHDPEVVEGIRNLGLQPVYRGPEDFQQKWKADQERIRKMVTDTGILQQIKSQTK
jgi:tripartite-type tricarboxylate transporter receptor subunit TctC